MATGNYEYQSDFAKRYIAEGRAEGQHDALVRVLTAMLEHRGFVLSDAHRQSIAETDDAAQLEQWILRVVTAKDLDDVFS